MIKTCTIVNDFMALKVKRQIFWCSFMYSVIPIETGARPYKKNWKRSMLSLQDAQVSHDDPTWWPTMTPPTPTLSSFLSSLVRLYIYDQLFMLSWGCPRGRPVQGPRKATGAHTSGTGCPCTLAVLSRTTAVSSAKILVRSWIFRAFEGLEKGEKNGGVSVNNIS